MHSLFWSSLVAFILILFDFGAVTSQKTILIGRNIYVTYQNMGTYTEFKLVSPLDPRLDIEDCWIAVGFNLKRKMSNASVVVCRNSYDLKSVDHYYNSGYKSELLDDSNAKVGLSAETISVSDSELTCSFRRNNSDSTENYFDLNSQPAFILAAYGKLGENMGKKSNRFIVFNFTKKTH